jgi:hypothetical protein
MHEARTKPRFDPCLALFNAQKRTLFETILRVSVFSMHEAIRGTDGCRLLNWWLWPKPATKG